MSASMLIYRPIGFKFVRSKFSNKLYYYKQQIIIKLQEKIKVCKQSPQNAMEVKPITTKWWKCV